LDNTVITTVKLLFLLILNLKQTLLEIINKDCLFSFKSHYYKVPCYNKEKTSLPIMLDLKSQL